MTAATPEGEAGAGPTVLRILLGGQLRKLREAHGFTREAAGYHIRASESKISRMELGRVGFKERDVADLLTFYGVTDDDERAALIGLAQQANTRAGGTSTRTSCPTGSRPISGWRRRRRRSATTRSSSCRACCSRPTTPARSSSSAFAAPPKRSSIAGWSCE